MIFYLYIFNRKFIHQFFFNYIYQKWLQKRIFIFVHNFYLFRLHSMTRTRLLSSTSKLSPHVVPGLAFLAVIVRLYRPICVLLIFAAFVAFFALAHPEVNKRTQVLEHALQPGMALSIEITHFLPFLCHFFLSHFFLANHVLFWDD